MAEPEKKPHAADLDDETRAALLRELTEGLLLKVAAERLAIEPHSATGPSPDFVIRTQEGDVLLGEAKFKPARNERLKEVQSALVEIRERNQNAKERLAKLKQRLAAA